MLINELNTNKLTEDILKTIDEDIEIYGVSDNLLFFKKGNYTNVFDVKENRYLFRDIDGFITSVRDQNDNKCFRIIKNVDLYTEFDWLDYYIYHYKCRDKLVCPCSFVTQNGLQLLDCFILAHNRCLVDDNYSYLSEPTAKNYMRGIQFNDDEAFHLMYSIKYFEDNDKSFWLLDSKWNVRLYDILNSNNDKNQFQKNSYDDWEAKSEFKYNLSIVYKNGKYAVMDLNHKIVFDYDENINYINILSEDCLGLKNKKGQNAIYKLGYGYILDFNDENKYRYIHMINNDVYHIKIFVLAEENEVKFIDFNGTTLLIVKSDNLYISAWEDAIYYKEGSYFYHYDFRTKKKQKLNLAPIIRTEDNQQVDKNMVDILQKYQYYYMDDENNQIILCKNKKYGIQLRHGEIKSNAKWFNNQKEVYSFEKQILDDVINLKFQKQQTKRRVRKKQTFK